MGDEQQREGAALLLLEEQLEHALAGGAVEVSGGLVGHEDGGVEQERTGDRNALLLAAGEAPRAVAQALAEAKAPQDLGCTVTLGREGAPP